MNDTVVAKRYADALFQLGSEKAATDVLVEEFRTVKDIFQDDKKLQAFLQHPRISNEKKKQFIDEVFKSFSKDVVNTLKILIERHRIGLITSIVDFFVQLVNDAQGIAEATVYSVRELSDTEKEQLQNTFAKRFNKKAIKLENVVDPSIIGGIKVRVGNTIYDGTISGKLQRIERNIVTAN
ncbi:F0F1 ATP synthase subunit delta [Virgibacillus kekensis]|uniref:ATP synthase subunit delta n=1 Tax=Virgibacillus kekensis TaxID=202261 RepID=A0ABV9DJF5_9BACI